MQGQAQGGKGKESHVYQGFTFADNTRDQC